MNRGSGQRKLAGNALFDELRDLRYGRAVPQKNSRRRVAHSRIFRDGP